MENELLIKYDPNIITLLGEQLYRQFPPVLNELLSNSYDAHAHNVSIILNKQENKFSVIDDGDGMSFNDLQDKYLVIGRNRRNYDQPADDDPSHRNPTGRKGVGKLAPFGIANEITVTTKKNNQVNSYTLNLNEIQSVDSGESYRPKRNNSEMFTGEHGTCIVVSDITLKNFSRRKILDDATALSRRFHAFGPDFKVQISDSSDKQKPIEISNDYYFGNLNKQFVWDIDRETMQYLEKSGDPLTPLIDIYKVSGSIFTLYTPIKDSEARGIFTYSRGKLASESDFFGNRNTDQFNNYVTGTLNIDYIDGQSVDAINTSRQGISWEKTEELETLQKLLQKLLTRVQSDWRIKRKDAKLDEINSIVSNSDDKTIHKYSYQIKNDEYEQKRYRYVNNVLADTITNVDDDSLVEKMIDSVQHLSKFARQDSSVYKPMVKLSDELERKLLTVNKTNGNTKIQKIISEIHGAPIPADEPNEYIIAETLLLRGLIDAATSAYIANHLSDLKIQIDNTQINDFDDLKHSQDNKKYWWEKHTTKTKLQPVPVDVEDGLAFKIKYEVTVKLMCRLGIIDGTVKTQYINAFNSVNYATGTLVKDLNMTMHSPNGYIVFDQLNQHWSTIEQALEKIIKSI
ncbi:ATP-binding protein [Leuconostoc gelidum subsp. gasicomitatum]|uniref:ATP-binding protein n=1 Tax=Leuconostoc gasicomitatum TaxID=115778 RepID=UPI001CC3A73D|nr:ATP-binding protein [Leuconostoc gasicomitatum]MBZ5960939.1 ATP-binding protein [Leuconostoc gasicomitatum]